MEYITFGKTDLKPSIIGCGCSQIASLSTKHPRSEVKATLLEAFDRGINFFDTADIYGQGDSERLLGKLFREKRHKIILCTKAGLTISLSQTFIRWIKPLANPLFRHWQLATTQLVHARRRAEKRCFNPNYLKTRIISSLRRLQTDYLDLFLLHSPPITIVSDHKVFEMLEQLKNQGIIRYYGISVNSVKNSMTFLNKKGIACLQVPGNLMQFELLNQILPAAKKKNIAIISREPFGGGSIFSYAPLQKFCQTHPQYKMNQVAMQYLLQRNDKGLILVGMTCRNNLYENLNVFNTANLSAKEFHALEKLIAANRSELK